MDTATIDALLKEEYFHLGGVVEDFDQKALTIKAWSVTLGMAGIGAAFSQKVPVLLLLSGVASILFWLVEALWKSFQQAHYARLREIEAYMRGDSPTIMPLQINSSWYRAWRSNRRVTIMKILRWPHVFLPHVCVSVGGPLLWLLNFAHPLVAR